MTFESAHRMAEIPPYIFARLGARIAEMNAEGRDVIRLDMGSPDLPPASFIIDALSDSARQPNHHGYMPFGGIPEFKKAVATYYHNRFGVEVDPAQETLALLGSKEGIANMAVAYIDAGDITLVPDPGYPTYTVGTQLAGGTTFNMPLRAENGFLPDFGAIPPDIARRAKLMWLNYPNNPTGAIAPTEFFEEAIDFCRRYNIILCHDNPYCEVTYGGFVAPSILQMPGAREVAVEFNSFSKSYNMGGWRLGMAVGNRQVIATLARVKSNVDSSHFRAIFDAGIAALTGDQTWLVERNNTYRQRRDIIVESLRSMGMEVQPPQATIYVWPRIPSGYTSAEYANRLLEEGSVSVTAGSAFGPSGEGYLRISLGTPTARVREAMERWRAWEEKEREQAVRRE